MKPVKLVKVNLTEEIHWNVSAILAKAGLCEKQRQREKTYARATTNKSMYETLFIRRPVAPSLSGTCLDIISAVSEA